MSLPETLPVPTRDKFQSNEEFHFANWLEELKEQGYVIEYEYEPEPFCLLDSTSIIYRKQLKTKTSERSKNIFRQTTYTTDFKIVWNTDRSDGVLTYTDEGVYDNLPAFYVLPDSNISYVEVKPSYDQNNMTRAAKIKIAWVMDKLKVYIELIKPESLFKKTFYPTSYLLNDSRSDWRKKKLKGSLVPIKDINALTVDQFLS